MTTNLDLRYWSDKRVCVTGGAGFLGWHLVQQLLPLAKHVRIFGLRPKSQALLARLADVEHVVGDVRDANAIQRAVSNCDVVFHTAGTVGVWGKALERMNDIHVGGTRNVTRALAPHARLVHTSSIVAIGASRRGEVLAETSPFNLGRLKVDYVHAKKAAEDVALAAAANGQDVVVVNPSYLLGPDDYEGSVMGRICVRVWRGKVPLAPPGRLNFVDVRDVARGHLLAAERGARGARYILAGVDRSMLDFVRELAAVRGMSIRWLFAMPRWLQTLLACGGEFYGWLKGREPYPSLQYDRLSRYDWNYSSRFAETEIGYASRPFTETLRDAHEWFCDDGQLKRTASEAKRTPLDADAREQLENWNEWQAAGSAPRQDDARVSPPGPSSPDSTSTARAPVTH